jgi:hypothetical protein
MAACSREKRSGRFKISTHWNACCTKSFFLAIRLRTELETDSMKKFLVTYAMLGLLISAPVQAGSFGGPPPFTNGSPLTSGTDGSYQASVRGKNLSGVVKFAQSGGTQSATGNSYAVFSNGLLYTGNTDVSIMNSKISGVLLTSGTVTGNTASGFFNANLDRSSPYGSFKGKGELTTNNGSKTTEVVAVTEETVGATTTTTTETTNTTNPVNEISTDFKIKGARTNTGA